MAALIPQWRITRLVTFNRNAKNVSVYDGLWAKCVKQDGYSGCYYYDSEVSNLLSFAFAFFFLLCPDLSEQKSCLLVFPVVL